MSDAKFIDGLIFKAPHENAPEFVIAKVSIKREELIAWLQGQSGEWINGDLKESRDGKLYASVDDWKPNTGNGTPRRNAPAPQRRDAPADDFVDSDIPFITNRGRY